MAHPSHSRSRVNKAGKAICAYLGDPDSVDESALVEHFEVADLWRLSHSQPLNSIAMGLRSFTATVGVEAAVTQRHKRLARIIGKLGRSGGSSMLARMQDIGGARVVFDTLDDLRAYEAHLDSYWEKTRTLKRSYDYIASPRDTGYRAVHKVVTRHNRDIEVQLRTRSMHDWANTVERLGRQVGVEFKTGAGDSSVLEYFAVIADINWTYELGEEPDAALHLRRDEALKLLRGDHDE